jgi:uncharacterized lipoprotein YddW (UPF0748 family)
MVYDTMSEATVSFLWMNSGLSEDEAMVSSLWMSISEGAHIDASMFDDHGTEEWLIDEAYVFAEALSDKIR